MKSPFPGMPPGARIWKAVTADIAPEPFFELASRCIHHPSLSACRGVLRSQSGNLGEFGHYIPAPCGKSCDEWHSPEHLFPEAGCARSYSEGHLSGWNAESDHRDGYGTH